MMTAGAPPPAAIIEKMEALGISKYYMFTDLQKFMACNSYEWHEEWDDLPTTEQATLKAKQGVRYPVLEGLMVADPETMAIVPADGIFMGEVFML